MASTRCPIHARVLLCPARFGSRGGRTVTPAKLAALVRARQALHAKLADAPK